MFDFIASWVGPGCPVERLGLDEVFVDISSQVNKVMHGENGVSLLSTNQNHSEDQQDLEDRARYGEICCEGVVFPCTTTARRTFLKPGM